MGAAANYHDNHRNALIEAARPARPASRSTGALLLEAFSNHYLTDSFSSGHVRTPRQTLAEEWHAKVPMFFTNFKMFMAERIAKYINDHNIRGALTVDTLMFKGEGVFPAGALPTIEKTLAEKAMPPITFGDIVSGALHDYDNKFGVDVDVEGKRMKLFGDSQLLKAGTPPTRSRSRRRPSGPASTRSRRRTRTASAADEFLTATVACSPPS